MAQNLNFDDYIVKCEPKNFDIHVVFKFENGYGASIIKTPYSYGGDRGLWELAVIRFTDDVDYDLCYDTEITDDVLGYLSDEEVEENLKRIKELS